MTTQRIRAVFKEEIVSGSWRDDAIVLDDGRVVEESELDWLPPLNLGKVIAVHLNYKSRLDQLGMEHPSEPMYFIKSPNSISAHRRPVVRPEGQQWFFFEGELAAVLGKRLRRADESEAAAAISHYTIANDFVCHEFREWDMHSMIRAKGADSFGPLGPGLVSAADVNLSDLILTTRRDGEIVQEAKIVDDLLFPISTLISVLSRWMTLEPGDVVLTGTPAGSGPVLPGQTLEVEIPGVGRLTNFVIAEEETDDWKAWRDQLVSDDS